MDTNQVAGEGGIYLFLGRAVMLAYYICKNFNIGMQQLTERMAAA